jgi:hypothetical protein
MEEYLMIVDPFHRIVYSGKPIHVESSRWKELCKLQQPYKTITLTFDKDELNISQDWSYRHMKNGKVAEHFSSVNMPLDDKVRQYMRDMLRDPR